MARKVRNDNICVNTFAPGLTLSKSVMENRHWSGEWVDRNRALKGVGRNR